MSNAHIANKKRSSLFDSSVSYVLNTTFVRTVRNQLFMIISCFRLDQKIYLRRINIWLISTFKRDSKREASVLSKRLLMGLKRLMLFRFWILRTTQRSISLQSWKREPYCSMLIVRLENEQSLPDSWLMFGGRSKIFTSDLGEIKLLYEFTKTLISNFLQSESINAWSQLSIAKSD